MNWTYIVLLICLMLAIFAVWREVQRESKRHLALRIVAVLVAIAGLACIILPITYEGDISLNEKNQAVLLTEGYNPDSISTITSPRIYTLSKSIKKAYPKAVLISSVDDLTQAKPIIGSLQVFGYGSSEEQLAQLHNLPVQFHSPKLPNGVSSVSWNAQLKTGEKLSVQGSFSNTTDKAVKVSLKGLGTTVDSAFIQANTAATFDLNTTPRHAGRAIYRLISTTDADTLANESIPVTVDAIKPLKILMLAGSPNFEDKFLKNWLTEKGYGVAVRSAISKDKFSQEFVNVEQQSLAHLTPGLLEKFDIILSDLEVLKSLNVLESGTLKQEVLQKGLGIIVRADSTAHSNFWLQQNYPVTKVSTAGQVVTSLKIQGQDGSSAKLLLDPIYITAQNCTQPLVFDQQNHILASSSLAGSGKEVFTVLNATHNWMLSGDENDYTALWSLLITKAAKHTPTAEQWSVVNKVPAVNSHTKFQLETSAAQPEIRINQSKIAIERNVDLPFVWHAAYWPQHAGWQQVQQGTGVVQWLFVYPQNEWTALKYNSMLRDTKKYASAFDREQSVTKQIHQKVQIPVSKIYFYILLLLGCTYLWAEAKFAA
jgi:hypothetical protein